MKILIADDDASLCHLLGEQVRPWGYEPVMASDGLKAVETLRAPGGPRLALLDWLMPGLNGIEVCRWIRHDPDGAYAYLVLLTGQGGRDQMLQGLEAGADDFLAKPVDPAELRVRLGAGRRIVTLQEQLLAAQRDLHERATRDGLTGVWNRTCILDILAGELARSRREGHPVGVILADLDHFKLINDTHGHLAGDQVLREAARRMTSALRPYDVVGRYGGEEFLVVLPGCPASDLAALAERLRRCVADPAVTCGEDPVAVTVSLGVAAWDGAAPLAELLRSADEALYAAKRGGRDRAEWASLPGRGLHS